jgi:hypothetical protein
MKPVKSGEEIILGGEDELDPERKEEEGSPLSDLPDILEQEPKRARVDPSGMSLEEYEAMLDAEAEEGEGGFLEAGNIPEIG